MDKLYQAQLEEGSSQPRKRTECEGQAIIRTAFTAIDSSFQPRMLLIGVKPSSVMSQSLN